MGVWQVTNETQPYVGQWDIFYETIWNGEKWVPFSDFAASWRESQNGVQAPATTAKGGIINNPPKEWFEEERKDRAWEALKSMF